MTAVARAPDGGWGWVVVIASAVSQMLTIGMLWALSVLYVSWLEEFDQGKGLTSWIISLGYSLLFGVGPISASLASRFGHRAVVMVGGLMTGIGIIVCYWATSVHFLIVAIGLFAGFGCGLTYVSAVAIVTIYFNRKRSLASGISLSGVSVGSFILAPLLEVLEHTYGWRNTILILGALTLNLILCGLVMRPLDVKDVDDVSNAAIDNVSIASSSCEEKHAFKEGDTAMNENSSVVCQNGYMNCANDDVSTTISSDVVERSSRHPTENRGSGDVQIDTKAAAAADIKIVLTTANGDGDFNDSPHPMTERSPETPRHVIQSGPVKTDSIVGVAGSMRDLDIPGESHVPLRYRKANSTGDITTTGTKVMSFNHSTMSKGSVQCFRQLLLVTPFSLSRGGGDGKADDLSIIQQSCSAEPSTFNAVNCPPKQVSSSLKESILEAIRANVELMKDLPFMILAISHMLLCIAAFTVSVYMVDRMVFLGIDKFWASIIVSVSAGGNFFGRVFFGFASDHICQNHIALYTGTVGVSGVSTLLSPLCGSNLFLHGLYAGIVGFCTGGSSILTLVVNVDVMGISKVASTYGLLMTFMGLGNLVGMPMAGWLFDLTQTYTIPYIVQGLCFMVAALMLVWLYVLMSRRRKCQLVLGEDTLSDEGTSIRRQKC